MRRFFVDPSKISEANIIIDEKSDVSHIVNVLRMDVGDKLIVSDMSEFEYTSQISEISKNEIVLSILDKNYFSGEPEVQVTLFQGIPKSSKMDLIVQKTIELGVIKIVPFVSLRTSITKVKDVSPSKIERWRRIAAETVKQCRRGIVPEVANPLTIGAALDTISDFDLAIVLYELEDETSLKDVLRDFLSNNNNSTASNIAVIIGSEGGLERQEIEALVLKGAKSVTIGNRILRTETAGLAAIAMLYYEFEL